MSRAGRVWLSALGLCAAVVAAGLALLLTASPGTGSGASAPELGLTARSGGAASPPVYAYFYQWFTQSSWLRAKEDYPLVGRYSSDSTTILREQVHQARAAGIDGFLTSWKDTPALDRRLERLIRVASQWHFDVGVVYESLDFARKPLPIGTVERDMQTLVDKWGTSLRSRYYGRPLIIWTGTNDYSRGDIAGVRAALGGRALLLAASKSVADYEQIADLVDGEAYYWSSADPANRSFTATKLNEMGAAVHSHRGIWIAPATAGFDGRALGHTRVVPRRGGDTLRQSLAEAYASRPDAIGVISWNEWSENTYIEPGHRYGTEELDALRKFLAARPDHPLASSNRTRRGWTGALAAGTLGGLSVSAGLLAWVRARRTTRRAARPGPATPVGAPDRAA